MGQALDREGKVLGEATGSTKREVFEELQRRHPDADEIRIKSVRGTSARGLAVSALQRLLSNAATNEPSAIDIAEAVDAIIDAARASESTHTRAVAQSASERELAQAIGPETAKGNG
jgi:hypothetical protein